MQQLNPLDWIKVSAANTYGNSVDKYSVERKVEWFNSQSIDDLKALAAQADEPCRYLRALYEHEKARTTGSTAFAVGLDAAASGIQVLSVLTGCVTGCINTGLASDTPQDVYLTNYRTMGEHVELPEDIQRKDLKKALMTMFYGSSAVPKRVFEKHPHLLVEFYKACSITAPGAWSLYNILMDIMASTPNQEEYRWTMPNGFVVSTWAFDKVSHEVEIEECAKKKVNVIRHHVKRTERYRALAANVAHSTDGYVAAEVRGRAMYNRDTLEAIFNEMVSKGIRPDMDASMQCMSIYKAKSWKRMAEPEQYKMMAVIDMTLNIPQYDLFTVHDEFFQSPRFCNVTKYLYQEVMAEIAESNLLESILSDICGEPCTIDSIDNRNDVAHAVRNGCYGIG